jgi:ABC-type dipeptide/oligopeptide/nickel transport system permease component
LARFVLRLLIKLVTLVLVSTFLLFLVIYLSPGARFAGNPVSAYLEWGRRLFIADQTGGLPLSLQLIVACVYTISISLTAVFIMLAVVWGLSWAAVVGKKRRLVAAVSGLVYAVSCLPAISLALVLIVIFVAATGNLPYVDNFGRFPVWLRILTLALPVAVLALGDGKVGNGFRFLREELRRVAAEPFMVAVKARGVNSDHHLRKNMIPSVVSITVSSAASILGWTFVVEYLFNLKGLGFLLVDHFNRGSYQTVLAITAISAVVTLLIHFAGKIVIAVSDPRVREGV